MKEKLYRSAYNKKIAGVCGGIAEYLGIDAGLVRFIAVILLLFGRTLTLVVYAFLAWQLPVDSKRPYDRVDDHRKKNGRRIYQARPADDDPQNDDQWSDF
ncbi:phage shock protein C (PspC) family protein [Aerococcus urinaehominis]|uniref:PspC domain-containing protein n=1 Tax=Aerococcus urinaehominis TaxID=128944 RepID=UPI00088C83BB|nr:PspC domain-containing protein [Aerococcus urinaehominis]SDM29383.1 phage shock protein C (PspC) family protein [Aerococcus urinaehominis]